MKITIAYLPEEGNMASVIKGFIKRLHPDIKVHESDRHAPYKHIYLATKKPESNYGSQGQS